MGSRVLVLGLWLCGGRLRAAEDHIDYKFEYYSEDLGRTQVRTHATLFEVSLSPWASLKGSAVYDGISGATPTGAPPPPGSSQVRMLMQEETRYGGTLEPAFRIGPHTLRPQIAVSWESDYESIAPALNYQLDFNGRNSTLNLGVAHNFDRNIQGTYLPGPERRESTDFLVGFTHGATPSTLLNLTLTLGTAHGYLSDPYKGFLFTEYPVRTSLFPEQRPGHRTKQIVSASLTQFLEPLAGSAELTYRFYHDSFGIVGHTGTLEWFQNLGRHLVVAPLFRYYEQSAADFYLLQFAADPSDSENPHNRFVPQFYSSDYRLSSLRTLTTGVSLTWRPRRWVSLDAAYKRYMMFGLDGVTSASNYPQANVYTLGLRVHF